MSSEWSIHIHYINRIYTVWLHPLGHTMSKHSSTERSRIRMNWWPMKGYPSEWAGIYCSSEYTDWTSSHFVRSMWSTKIIGTWCHTSTAPHTHTHRLHENKEKEPNQKEKYCAMCVVVVVYKRNEISQKGIPITWEDALIWTQNVFRARRMDHRNNAHNVWSMIKNTEEKKRAELMVITTTKCVHTAHPAHKGQQKRNKTKKM